MRLPQDRILHIGTELKDGKMNIVAEWQGEIVRCRDCWHWDKTPHTYCNFHDIKSIETDYCSWGERREDGKLAIEQMEYDTLYEPTYNLEDGSM